MAFTSGAANLVPGDTNSKGDVFLVDRWLNTIERVSVGTGNVEGDGISRVEDISGDGRYVVFTSESTNWDPRDPDPDPDVYVRDRVAKTTELISVPLSPYTGAPGGSATCRISPDGRFVVFADRFDTIVPGDVNGFTDVFLYDRTNGTMELVSVDSSGTQADYFSAWPALSDDGRYVAFVSGATNWYPGNPPPGFNWPLYYAYVRDRVSQTTIPIHLDGAGNLGSGSGGTDLDLSADGRYLAYYYGWIDPVRPIQDCGSYVRDLLTGEVQPVGYSVFGNSGSSTNWKKGLSLSADGRFVVFASYSQEQVLHTENKSNWNVFLVDRLTGITHAAGLGPNDEWPSVPGLVSGTAHQASISADGTAVAFASNAPSFGSGNSYYNIYVRTCDWTQPSVYCDPQPNSQHCRPAISFSGSPSASAGSSFTVEVDKLVGAGAGFFFYSTRRPILTPMRGGYLCMELPISRLPVQSTGGSPPPGCTGRLSVDFNAWIAAGTDPSLVPGENVCIQAWSRDGAAPTGGNLSNAVAFLVGP